jgi:Bacterial SH3 domain
MAQTRINTFMTLPARSLFTSLALLMIVFAAAHESAARTAQVKSRITIASGVRVRSTPSTSGEEVARLQIGTVVNELEQSSAKEKVGSSEDYWYRVATGDGKEGWVFGGFTAPFDSNRVAEIYRSLARERLKVENLTFFDLADLARFLSSATADVKDEKALAELEFARLVAMKRAVGQIPADYEKGSPYDTWIKANEASLIYSDPAAVHFLKSQLLWDLQKKYNALPIAEAVAWEAANNPIGGECEGYVPCHLAALNMMLGRYVALYPRGAHADEALTSIAEDLKGLVDLQKGEGQPIPEVRAEGRKELATLRDVVTKAASPKKAAALDHIAKLAQYYK